MNAPTRWLVRLGGLGVALLIYLAWPALGPDGLVSAILRVVVVLAFVVWFWRATRSGADEASPRSSMAIESTRDTEISQLPEDPFWARASAEWNSGARDDVLWTRCLGEAGANAAVAEVQYLRERARQLADEQKEQQRFADTARDSAQFSEAMRIVESLPKGKCPGCEAVILLSAQECPRCHTSFLPGSGRKIVPLNAPGDG